MGQYLLHGIQIARRRAHTTHRSNLPVHLLSLSLSKCFVRGLRMIQEVAQRVHALAQFDRTRKFLDEVV